MSIPVAIDDLVAETERYGFAYLLTVRDDQTPHVVAVNPTWRGDTAVMEVGRGTAHNAAARSSVTLCFPPTADGGYSLIVDGAGLVDAGADEPRLSFRPTGAVLHRPAAPGLASVTGCENDCLPVGDPSTADA